jgi:FkbM family methyltransferase
VRLFFPFKPEYVYRPGQVLRRIRLTQRCVAQDECSVDLPWGLPLRVNPHELIGNCVVRHGVYDLAVSEALWRLLDPGETAVDVGSNIGYTASILARRAGPSGHVYCFEPHPDVFRRLQRNVALWGLPVTIQNAALSDTKGVAELRVPRYFTGNQGTASLEMAPSDAAGPPIRVATLSIDGLEAPTGPIALMKVDVEGHELAVFQGAARRLQSGAIRDIVFEDHGEGFTPAMRLLLGCGYRLFALRQRFRGPLLAPADAPRDPSDPPSYLATRDETRARERFGRPGWFALRSRPVV